MKTKARPKLWPAKIMAVLKRENEGTSFFFFFFFLYFVFLYDNDSMSFWNS